MGPLHLGLPILIAVIVLLRYSGLGRRRRRRWAKTRPANRDPIDELHPQIEHSSVEDPVGEHGHPDPNDELPPQAEYEPVEEPNSEPGHQDLNDELPPHAEYEPREEPDVELAIPKPLAKRLSHSRIASLPFMDLAPTPTGRGLGRGKVKRLSSG